MTMIFIKKAASKAINKIAFLSFKKKFIFGFYDLKLHCVSVKDDWYEWEFVVGVVALKFRHFSSEEQAIIDLDLFSLIDWVTEHDI